MSTEVIVITIQTGNVHVDSGVPVRRTFQYKRLTNRRLCYYNENQSQSWTQCQSTVELLLVWKPI